MASPFSLEALAPEVLGFAESVEEQSLGEEVYTFVEGVKNPFSCMILVKGAHRRLSGSGPGGPNGLDVPDVP